MKQTQTIVLISILISLIVSTFFIKIPYNIDCAGKILPAREWIVRSADGGDIISIYNNHKKNQIYDYIDYKFERGDIARLIYSDKFAERYTVNKGDTIGFISSYLLELQWAELKGSLNEEEAYLKAINSGEKKSLIESAKSKLALSNQDFEIQSKTFERQKALYEKQIIPAAEYEIALKAYDLAKTNVDLAKSNQLTLQTGEKPELINYSNVKIGSAKDKLRILDQKRQNYALVAPFDGKIMTKKVALNNTEASTLYILHVIDTSEYIVLLPIELFQRNFITSEMKFTTSIPYDNRIIEGTYAGEDQDVELTGSYKQVFITKGSLKPDGIKIPYGIYTSCTINCGKVSLFDYIKRKIRL